MAKEWETGKDAKELPEEHSPADLSRIYDCSIVGGGPAGLSAAIYLGRMRRSVVVIDSRAGRSSWHQVNRNYMGFPDGIHASALRQIGEKQAALYGARFWNAKATDVRVAGDGRERCFYITTDEGQVAARSLILATGVHDRFPEFEGSEECIGKSMFWCIICDGYEATGKKIVVLGHGSRAAKLTLELLVFTDDVSLVAWDAPLDVPDETLSILRERGVQVYDSECNVYQCSNGQVSTITLDDGAVLDLDMLFVVQKMEPNNQLAKQLSCTLDEHGFLITDTEQATNVEGVFGAGDLTKLHNHQVTSAVHEGGMAAAAVNYYLYEDWQK